MTPKAQYASVAVLVVAALVVRAVVGCPVKPDQPGRQADPAALLRGHPTQQGDKPGGEPRREITARTFK
ncbi:unnamed protein product, partial [marine sediment metagenome]